MRSRGQTRRNVRSQRGRLSPPLRLLLIGSLLLAAACTSTPPPPAAGDAPDATVAAFVAAWRAAKPEPIAALTTDPGTAGQQLGSILKNLAPTRLTVTTGPITRSSNDSAQTTATYLWTLPHKVSWKYVAAWPLARKSASDPWRVQWAATVINPKLGPAQTAALRTAAATDGALLDRANQQIIGPVTVFSVVALPGKVTNLPVTAAALEKVLKPFDASVTVASVTAGVAKADAKAGYTVTNLRESDYQRVRVQLASLPGLIFPSTIRDLPPTKDFAKILLSEVQPVAAKMALGTAGWRVVSLDTTGAELDTLASVDPKPGANVTLSMDSGIQQAAEAALAGTPEPAVLVAIKPSTGEILAVAQNAPANAQGPLALMGEYPPGSTFKVVTATAGFDAKTVTPTTEVDCPGQVVVSSHSIHNEGFELGTVPLTTAFAKSCNTTFAKLATTLPDAALPAAASEYGIGRDFVIPGLTTLTGKVPVPDSTEQKAENGFGQGVVLVTPFSQALMAATAATGNMPTPTLIKGATTTIDSPAPPRSALSRSGIRVLMRAVVTDGTARVLQDAGEVYAKTGTADFTDPKGQVHAHAWTVGFRGDLAFSVLIVAGDTSKRTNLIADAFLKSVPAG